MTPKHNFKPGDIVRIINADGAEQTTQWRYILAKVIPSSDEDERLEIRLQHKKIHGWDHAKGMQSTWSIDCLQPVPNPSRFELVLNGLED